MSQEPKVTRFGADPTVAQELATKAYVDSGGGNTFARVIKILDETINSDIVLHNDNELFVALEASKTYGFIFLVYQNTGSTPDIDFAFSVPSGATGGWNIFASNNTIEIAFGAEIKSNGFGVTRIQPYMGRVIMDTTPGNLQLQWAQTISNAGDTSVLAGTTLVVWEEI